MTESVPNNREADFDESEEIVSEDAQEEVPEEGTDSAAAPEADVGSESSEGAAHAELQKKFDEVSDRHLRLAAEFNNFRRRTEQERLEAWSRAQSDLAAKFLDLLDDLQRVAGLDLSNATVEAIMEGIDLVERKFGRVLTDAGIEAIDPLGETFDPERMEAVMRVPAESDEDDDTVAAVFQKGYSLKGVLVRPARVSVHKHE